MASKTGNESISSETINVDGDEVTIPVLYRGDGWTNLMAGMGGGNDRRTRTFHTASLAIHHNTLTELYRFNGLAKKIIDIPAKEMTRQWISIEGDTENIALDEFSRLNAKSVFRDWLKWGSLYGGAIIVLGVDDGGGLEMPLNPERVRNIEFMRVYDRHQVYWNQEDIENDPNSNHYGQIKLYNVNSYTTGTSFKVHRSRVIRHDGCDIPERARISNNGWGDSFIQGIYEELRDMGIVRSSVVGIIQDFIQTILQIDNLNGMLQSNQEDVVKARLNLIDLSRSVMNTVLLDGEEQYSKQASAVNGLAELIQEFSIALSAVTGIPITKLFGRSPAGMNATGESDIRNFYDEIKSEQEDILLPGLNRLLEIMKVASEGPLRNSKGLDLENLKIEFNPLWQMDDKQEAEWKKLIAETDKIYLDGGVVGPEEIAVSRYENGFSADTKIDFSSRKLEPPVDPDDIAEEE